MDLLLNNHQTRGLHSLRILNEIETHRDLMESIDTVLDVESGIGLDSEWWATRTDLDEEPKVNKEEEKISKLWSNGE